ncbi:hypothetical protein B0T24DRAFT_610704 [Lasiosphaeria ovina]|uniref:NB-ARC domain-containing protein n=1 Tax=Lasiosphaeria ovina TaxID=92902 RepID=A0AAE0KMR2_9PEZI|nr:hypothetical protein B0T24DRAFT_610704 [Lasiosphaeria ovina]
MDTPELERHFEEGWRSTKKSCLGRVERDDQRTIRSCRSFEELKETVIEDTDARDRSEGALHELSLINPRLVGLRNFSYHFTDKLGPRLDPAVFWGLLRLVLNLALQFDDGDPMRRVAQMIKKLSRQAESFQDQCSNGSTFTRKEKEACFEIFVGMTEFFTKTVLFLRDSEDALQVPFRTGDGPWLAFGPTFDNAVHEIEESLEGLEKLAAMNQMRAQDNVSWLYSYLTLGSRPDEADVPCNMTPPTKNSRFFDRDDVIDDIDKHYQKKDLGPFRSLALYGMAGVGKTHIAMKYAQKKYSKRELNAVLWVAAETAMSIKQSFTEISLRLKLPNATAKSHDDNHLLVRSWLQHTKTKWLIVFDNADDPDILLPYWPNSASRGQAIITTRNHSLAYEPADAGLEVASWDTETGSKYILHLLSGYISADLLANQHQSAFALSERLSGHALALSNMAGVIHRRSWTIKELVDFIDSHPDFKDGLSAMWQLSFGNLQEHSAAILSVVSFCNPDSIPQMLFEPDDPSQLPADMQWCTDMESLSKAIEELQIIALIRRDRDTRQLAVHRLIQTHFRQFMSENERQAAFARASALLYAAFPRRDATKAQMFDVWERCSLWVQHVIALKDGFKQERKRLPTFRGCREFCELLVTCQRFILEQHAFPELADMVQVNEIALSTLDPADQTYDLLSSLPSHLGQMQARLGKSREALDSATKSRAIRLRDPEAEPREVAWAEHNIAQVLTTFGPLDEALEWHQLGLGTWKAWASSQQGNVDGGAAQIVTAPPVMKTGLGRCLVFMGRLEEARPYLESAYSDLMDTKPLNWAMAASARYAIGRLEMRATNYDVAEARFMEAQSLWLKGDKARTDHFNGACMYRMACCALDLGKTEAAIKHLHDAMIVTLIHKEYMAGEHARCLYKLSQALFQEPGREAESRQLLREAEELYFSLAGDANQNPSEEDYDSLVYCLWR